LRIRAAQNLIVMKKSAQRKQKVILPSPGELRLLQILWRIGGGTIEDIISSSHENPPPNYKTVQTLLRIMEHKGQVDHSQDGRAFVFRPLIGHSDLRRLSIREVVTKYFTGSPTDLVVELLRDERISRQELRELENLIRSRRRERQ
jgi:predicted transcriptional regulator